LHTILNPRSIAIVGASGNPQSSGYGYLKYQIEFGFKGPIYPINPNQTEILGLPVYPSLRDVPGDIDFVISCVSAGATLQVVDDCVEKGVHGIHIFTGRFGETGREEGRSLEHEILERARAGGMRIIGPNCFGVYNPAAGVSSRSTTVFPVEPGPIGFISQSGGLVWDLIYKIGLAGGRFSKAISYGNALDLSETDYLAYLGEDPQTRVIGAYIEGVGDIRRFLRVLKEVARKKPVVVLKGGRSRSGAIAAASHTGALAGSSDLWPVALRQAGAIVVDTPDELADMLIAFTFLQPSTGLRVGIAGGGGGHSVAFADYCQDVGLDAIDLPDEIRERLRESGSTIWDWIGNPADTSIAGGSNTTMGDILQLMAESDQFDMLIPVLGDWHLERPEGKKIYWNRVEEVAALADKTTKPMAVVLWWNLTGEPWRIETLVEAREKLIEAGLAVYPTFEQAARALRRFAGHWQRLERAGTAAARC
jgi:acyl-CoA synthetase (NDP forming)